MKFAKVTSLEGSAADIQAVGNAALSLWDQSTYWMEIYSRTQRAARPATLCSVRELAPSQQSMQKE